MEIRSFLKSVPRDSYLTFRLTSLFDIHAGKLTVNFNKIDTGGFGLTEQ